MLGSLHHKTNQILIRYEQFQRFTLKAVIMNNLVSIFFLVPMILIWTKCFLEFSKFFTMEYNGGIVECLISSSILTIYFGGIMSIFSMLSRLLRYFERGLQNLLSFISSGIITGVLVSFVITFRMPIPILFLPPIILLGFRGRERYLYVKKLNSFFLY